MRKKTLQLERQVYCGGLVLVLGKGTKPRYWSCRCSLCNREFEARGSRLVAGTVKCACQRKRHGHTAGGELSPTYESWKAMKARCKNARVASHGGRGITYESRWESFDSFLADMGERPPGASLDRINVFGNYCKENCRWADALTQANNKRATRYRRYDWMVGERVGGAYGSTAEWARYLKRLTGNAKWTSRKLNAVLEVIPSINDLVGAVSPSFGFAPEEFSIRSGTEFRHIWGDYLKAVYLSAA